MIDNQIIATVLVHLFIAILQLGFWRKTVPQRVLSIGGSFISLIFAIKLFTKVFNGDILIMHAANWEAPFGIVFVADLLSSTLVLLTAIAALAVSIFSATGIGRQRILYGYFPIFHFLVMGLNGAFLTGDIFNLYVFFEVIIISSFVLMTLGGRKAQLEGAVKYMAMNILASTFFLTGIGLLYGISGSLNMADLALIVPKIENRAIVDITATFFLIGFGIKSAIFPLYFWLPSSYHTPPSAVAAIFGGLLTKVGIYALFRVFTLIFIPNEFIRDLLLVLSILTILTGAFGALIKTNVRRLFSYLIVCHIGFMIGGLGMYSKLAILGAVFYLIHDIMVKTNLFLIAGLIRQMRGSMDMKKLGGLYAEYPKISLLIAIVLFSLAGIPPLSGFWPKIYLLQGAFENAHYFYAGALILGSFITLFVIAKFWSEVFWKKSPDPDTIEDKFKDLIGIRKIALILPICILAASSLYIGLNAEIIIQVADRISSEMLNTTPYIQAVLGK
ncbi:proton-conducting transporter membrane subunit [Sphingobacterium faecium]|jgi:multicomponent Na+:H+ antiporter subunit D|uniref:proton-conducting transporter transmembrane domain-containing protein n=1 Tax=Sphingobacterium faecium TaxID=34087 RepID=UPI0023771694|nr:proton-conducting transporter membrane subunit [Sphingobacterium faecium]UZJ66041.1 proton-conducting transporter membrane subunit [Sphingobacterium sp. KU25419]WGQ13292.1 proton-conducting transporter membrane subunit [Sphingobacterium faecium]